MSALADEVREAVRQVLRDVVRQEVRAALGDLLPSAAVAPEGLLDVNAAATRLGLGRSTVRKLARRCELASVKSGRRLLFKPADLDAYAQARRRSPERLAQLAAKSEE
jgi:excisionase family DNA binding protein